MKAESDYIAWVGKTTKQSASRAPHHILHLSIQLFMIFKMVDALLCCIKRMHAEKLSTVVLIKLAGATFKQSILNGT